MIFILFATCLLCSGVYLANPSSQLTTFRIFFVGINRDCWLSGPVRRWGFRRKTPGWRTQPCNHNWQHANAVSSHFQTCFKLFQPQLISFRPLQRNESHPWKKQLKNYQLRVSTSSQISGVQATHDGLVRLKYFITKFKNFQDGKNTKKRRKNWNFEISVSARLKPSLDQLWQSIFSLRVLWGDLVRLPPPALLRPAAD